MHLFLKLMQYCFLMPTLLIMCILYSIDEEESFTCSLKQSKLLTFWQACWNIYVLVYEHLYFAPWSS